MIKSTEAIANSMKLLDLPADIIWLIMTQCDLNTLMKLRGVSHTLKSFADQSPKLLRYLHSWPLQESTTRSGGHLLLFPNGKVIDRVPIDENGSYKGRSVVKALPDLKNVTKVIARNDFGVALTTLGEVWTWGKNGNGKFGLGFCDSQRHFSPQKIPNLEGILDIVKLSWDTIVARKDDGTVWIWGSYVNLLPFKLNKNHHTPQCIHELTEVINIVQASQLIVIKKDGSVVIAGQDCYEGTHRMTFPTTVHGLSAVKRVYIGDDFALALQEDGQVYSFGSNRYGQLGIGNDSTISSGLACKVTNLSQIEEIIIRSDHAYALYKYGVVYAWGRNDQGQLGLGHCSTVFYPREIRRLEFIKHIFTLKDDKKSYALDYRGRLMVWGHATKHSDLNPYRDDYLPHEIKASGKVRQLKIESELNSSRHMLKSIFASQADKSNWRLSKLCCDLLLKELDLFLNQRGSLGFFVARPQQPQAELANALKQFIQQRTSYKAVSDEINSILSVNAHKPSKDQERFATHLNTMLKIVERARNTHVSDLIESDSQKYLPKLFAPTTNKGAS